MVMSAMISEFDNWFVPILVGAPNINFELCTIK